MDWFVYDNDLRHERFDWVKIQKEEKKNERKTKKIVKKKMPAKVFSFI